MLNRPRLITLGKPRIIKLGPVIDISMGGLAVQYIETIERLKDSSKLSIIIPPNDIAVADIPFTTVTDVAIAELPDSREIRNRCLQFGKLLPRQTFQLEAFINKYGFDLLQDRRTGEDRRKKNDPQFDDGSYRIIYEKRVVGERRKFIRKKVH